MTASDPDHRTAPSDVVEHGAGWAPLRALGVEMVRLPLVDQRSRAQGALLARLRYRDALAVAAQRDDQLPTMQHLEAARADGLVLTPWTIGADRARMRRLSASIDHDASVTAQLTRAGWRGDQLVMGAGKHWLADAPRGRCRLGGWWVPELARYTPPKGQRGHRSGPGWVQEGIGDPHDDQHHDYGTTTLLVRPWVDLLAVLDVGAVAGALRLLRETLLGSEPPSDPRAAIVRAARADLHVREATGRNDGADVARYFEGCTRLLDGRERPTGWVQGWDWCAAGVSCWVHVGLGLRPGATAPIGRRISCRELVEDGRRSGRLRTERSYRPKPGDVGIAARAGGDPLKGGTGHTWLFTESLTAQTYLGLGGNEDNRVREAARRYDDPSWRAWIEVAA